MPPSPLNLLKIELLDTHRRELFRVWCDPGADWDPSPYSGQGRVDSPDSPPTYRVLYLSSTPLIALQEVRLLTEFGDSQWIFNRTNAAKYKITSYKTTNALPAATLDEPNSELLDLDCVTLLDGKGPYQSAAARIRKEKADKVPALYWRSKHRESNGNVVGIFHDMKGKVGLKRIDTILLLDHPVIAELELRSTVIFS